MHFLSKLFWTTAIIATLFPTVVGAIEIDRKTYCQLTVANRKQTYKILVPRENVQSVREQLNVVGINCRNEVK